MYKTVDKTIYKQAFSPENLIRCWDECLDKSSFASRRKQVEAFNKKNYWKKKGLAIIPMKFSVGFGATSYHQVRSYLCQTRSWPDRSACADFARVSPFPGRWAPCLSSTHLQALAPQCSREVPPWQTAALARWDLQLGDCQDGVLTAPLNPYSKREQEPTGPAGLCFLSSRVTGLGRNGAAPGLHPKPHSIPWCTLSLRQGSHSMLP